MRFIIMFCMFCNRSRVDAYNTTPVAQGSYATGLLGSARFVCEVIWTFVVESVVYSVDDLCTQFVMGHTALARKVNQRGHSIPSNTQLLRP